MNTLVVFDSQFGNTEKIARQIGEGLREFGGVNVVRVNDIAPDALDDVDLLVVGCPTQAWHSTKPMHAFIAGLPRERFPRMRVAAFDTRMDKPGWLTGSAAKGMAKQLRQLGAHEVLPLASFEVTGTEGPLVAGELDRALGWGKQLGQQVMPVAELVLA